MTDFENLLRSKPQDVHKRMKLSTDSSQPIAHLNLQSARPFADLYERFDDLEDPTYLID